MQIVQPTRRWRLARFLWGDSNQSAEASLCVLVPVASFWPEMAADFYFTGHTSQHCSQAMHLSTQTPSKTPSPLLWFRS